ncbi:MAG: hypothetical protein WDZ41_02840 [Candidatus Babeliales bacterium]
MKPGYTIIELILVLLLGSLLLSVLFTSFFQINRTSVVAEDIMDLNTRISILNNQLEKDFTGIFVPLQAIEELKKEPEKKVDQEKKKAGLQKKEVATKEKPKPLKDVFVSTNQAGNLAELTFITTNPIRVYEHAENAIINPRIVRVVYRLEADPEKKGSFNLTRQEGGELEFSAYKPTAPKKIKKYKLIDNIKEFKIIFKVPKKSDEKAKQETVTFETLSEWKPTIDKPDQKKPKIPNFIQCTVTFWDNQFEESRTFEFMYQVPCFQASLELKPTETVKPPEPSKEQAEKKQKAQGQKLPTLAEIKQSVKEIINLLGQKT